MKTDSPARHFFDGACLALALAAVSILAIRQLAGRGMAFQGWEVACGVMYGAFVCLVIWSRQRRSSRRLVGIARIVVYPITVGLSAAALSRAGEMLAGEYAWPPHERPLTSGMSWLSDEQRAEWIVRLAAHGLSRPGQRTGDIGGDWPVPSGALVRVDSMGDTVVIRGTVPSQKISCSARLLRGTLLTWSSAAETVVDCTPDSLSRIYRALDRSQPSTDTLFVRPAGTGWPQYRATADKLGALPTDRPPAAGFITHVGGSIRSSISVVGGMALVGSHGTGTLAAVRLKDGTIAWQTTVPNWIHEDPVSNGAVIVVGFGDNDRSFWGHTPAGVAAYRLSDGHHLWTAFESNSVMSSPVVNQGRVIYATASGAIVSRDISTGQLIARGQVPGSVQMAPPALIDTTLVVATGRDGLCSLDANTLHPTWCGRFEDALNTDAAAPAVIGNIIVQTGTQSLQLGRLYTQWREMGTRLFASVLWDVARGHSNRSTGQKILAVDLKTGSLMWSTAAVGAERMSGGHTSGTATAVGRQGVVVLPIADAIIGFDVLTGREEWRARAEGARGPMLALRSDVYSFSPNRSIRILDLGTGQDRCRYATEYGFDRAGPTLADGLLLAGTLRGDLVAIPKAALDSCHSFTLAGHRFEMKDGLSARDLQ